MVALMLPRRDPEQPKRSILNLVKLTITQIRRSTSQSQYNVCSRLSLVSKTRDFFLSKQSRNLA
jgi:hypothetical protein